MTKITITFVNPARSEFVEDIITDFGEKREHNEYLFVFVCESGSTACPNTHMLDKLDIPDYCRVASGSVGDGKHPFVGYIWEMAYRKGFDVEIEKGSPHPGTEGSSFYDEGRKLLDVIKNSGSRI